MPARPPAPYDAGRPTGPARPGPAPLAPLTVPDAFMLVLVLVLLVLPQPPRKGSCARAAALPHGRVACRGVARHVTD